MIDLSTVDHIYLVTGSTDLRKAADGCSAIVQYDLNMNPFTKDIFLFCNRHKNTIQILEWDENGFWLHKKKLLGNDRFRWPKTPDEMRSLVLDERQLKWLLSGFDINPKHAHHVVNVIVSQD